MRLLPRLFQFLMPVLVLLLLITFSQSTQPTTDKITFRFHGPLHFIPIANAQAQASPAALTGTPTPTIFQITQDPNAQRQVDPPYSPEISPLIFIVPGVFILLTLFLR